MPTVQPYQAAGSRGVSWQTGRVLAQLEKRTSVDIASLAGCADVQAARVDAVGAVAQRAMQGVAIFSQMEAQLGAIVPMAVSRLQAVGDIAALSMAQVVADTTSVVRGR